MKKTTEQQVVALFVQALRTALALIDDQPQTAAVTVRNHTAVARGIFPAKSKYNPYRAYWWDGQKSVYLGMFPSIAACKRAQREFSTGKQPSKGTRVANRRAPLVVVSKAA